VKLLDTMGWANPEQIRRTIDAVRNRRPELEIALHLHDTRGLGLANATAALHEGVREFDSAVAGMGGCPFAAVKGAPGNISTEDFAFLCEQMGIATGLDLDRLVDCVELAERIFGRSLPGHLAKGGLFRAQRPAGWAATARADAPAGVR
jgi:hydroxymethylglutaryl-CoA lyase